MVIITLNYFPVWFYIEIASIITILWNFSGKVQQLNVGVF